MRALTQKEQNKVIKKNSMSKVSKEQHKYIFLYKWITHFNKIGKNYCTELVKTFWPRKFPLVKYDMIAKIFHEKNTPWIILCYSTSKILMKKIF